MFKIKNNRTKRFGFTLVEVLIVVALIGLLTTVAVLSVQNRRASARDTKRVADIKKIQTALESYYYNQGHYPDTEEFTTSLATSGVVYLEQIPIAPTPADGDCSDEENAYTYTATGTNNGLYTLSFCLGESSGSLSAGLKSAGPDEISILAELPAGEPEPDDPMIATLLSNYKTRVESAGGALVDETAAYNLMKQIYDADLYSNLKLHISSDLGFKLPASQANFAFKENWNNASLSPYYSYNTTLNSITGGILTVTSNNNDPSITMSSLGSFDPNVYKYIEFRYRVVSGTAGYAQIFFLNTRRTSANGDQYVGSPTMISDGQWHTLRVYMGGHTYWTNSNITGWRYDWNTTASVQMELDYIGLTDGLGDFIAYDFSSSENNASQTIEVHQPDFASDGIDFSFDDDTNKWLTTAPITGPGSYSVSLWLYLNSLTSDTSTIGEWIINQRSDSGIDWQLFRYPTDTEIKPLRFSARNDNLTSFNSNFGSGSGNPALNEWIFLTATVDVPNGRVSTYVNATDKVQNTDFTGVAATLSSHIVIGRRGWGTLTATGGANPDGKMDDIRIYDTALSDSQVASIYNATKAKYGH